MYYSVIKLKKNHDIFFDDILLKVDVNRIKEKDVVGNDIELISSIEEGYYNWVSGGGTYFINNKYLVVVRRGLDSAINPGKFSLFTGRSDNHDERINPQGLVRELFEELILYYGNKFLYPKCKEYQDIIDRCYSHFTQLDNLIPSQSTDLILKEIRIDDRIVEIDDGNSKKEISLSWHINRFNDVNVLFLFNVNMDVNKIHARDAEYHIEKDAPVFHDRDIFLLDVNTNQLSSIRDKNQLIGEQYLDATENATEHLVYMLNKIKRKVI